MSGSAVRAVKPALVALWSGLVAGLEVDSGASFDPGVNYLLVGWAGGDQAAVTVARGSADAGLAQNAETIEISCLLSFWCGNKTAVQVEDDVYAAFEAIDDALDNDHTLGGTNGVLMAGITEYDYHPDIYETGEEAALRITVTVTAWK